MDKLYIDIIVTIARYVKYHDIVTYMNLRSVCKRMRNGLPIVPRLCKFNCAPSCKLYLFFINAYYVNPRETAHRFMISHDDIDMCNDWMRKIDKKNNYLVAKLLWSKLFDTPSSREQGRKVMNDYMIEAGFI